MFPYECDFLWIYPRDFTDFLESGNVCLSPNLGIFQPFFLFFFSILVTFSSLSETPMSHTYFDISPWSLSSSFSPHFVCIFQIVFLVLYHHVNYFLCHLHFAIYPIQGIFSSNIGKGCCPKTWICLFLFLCWKYLSFFFKSITFTSWNIVIIAASTFGLSGSWNLCWLSFSLKN